jgi:hypothetical protein
MTNDYAFSRQVRRRNFDPFRRPSGTDDRRRRRIKVSAGMDGYFGTKAAHGENEKDDLQLCPERLDLGDAGDAVTVPPGKRQCDHRHREDDGLRHQEMP